ncbi:PKD-like domain-containing protein [Fluviicola sp.]|uniref:T9SS type B sorting domain-containing protein n=1 Tax=Fluviicola sp. TaxID=1917219 RepID=UPI002624AC9F|nr:PKD-like domain-containing protein [Fluviicola sp.]
MKIAPAFILRTLFLIVLFSTCMNESLFSQPAGMPPCAPSTAPGESACLATPICNLNGYCGRTLSSYTVDAWPALQSAIITCSTNGWDQLDINNDSYLKFVAGSTSISFDVYVYDCIKPVTTKAIQLAVFSAANCGSGPVDVKYCNKQMNQQSTPHNVTINNLIPGETYYILIDGYSSQNCAYSFVATSGVSTGLSVNLSETTICAGESIDATVSGGSGTYAWSGDNGLGATSGSSITITPPAIPGTYNYHVESSGSTSGGTLFCPTSSEYDFSITVSNGSTPTFNPPGTVCSGQSFTLPTTSLEGISGTWSPAVNNSQTTTYTFIPASGSCANTATMTVAVNNQLTPNFNNPGPLCPGENFTLPTTSLEGINGTWSPAINNSQTTTYTFTPASGQCTNTTTMTVAIGNQITPGFNNPGPLCSGQSFMLPTTSLEGINGTWSPAVNNSQTTTYTFTPASGSGLCAATSATMEIVINPVPVATAQGQNICTGDATNISLNANIPGTTFSWTAAASSVSGASNGSGNVINQVLTSGSGGNVVYTIIPTAGTCAGNPINITVNVNATLPISILPGNSSICPGQFVSLTASGAISYTWFPSGGLNTTSGSTITASPATTTTYTVTGVSSSGCSGTETVIVTVLPEPLADFIPSVTAGEAPLEVVFQNTSVNANSYIWDFGNGQSSTSSNPTVSTIYHDAGTYPVILTASNGLCTDSIRITILVTAAADFLIHVPNVFTPNGDHVNDVFYIGTTNAKTVFVEIFNRWGNSMTKLEKPTDTWDGDNAPGGVYYYNYKITDHSDKIYEGQGFFHLERGK